MLLSKTVKVKWAIRNKKWYVSKGCTFTKMNDEIEVRVEDLSKGSSVIVDIHCDGENCNNIITTKISGYLRDVKPNGKYYCNTYSKHINIGFFTFEQWCIQNNKKYILDLWDYKLNKCKPSEISFGTNNKYYFKCSREIHESELKHIGGVDVHIVQVR